MDAKASMIDSAVCLFVLKNNNNNRGSYTLIYTRVSTQYLDFREEFIK